MASATRSDDLLTSVEVCRIAGITYRMLDYWCRTELVDVPGGGSGSSRRFDEDSLARVVFIARMTRAGVNLAQVRAALEDPKEMARLVADLERAATLAREFHTSYSGHPAGSRGIRRTG